jgi:SH3 domain protein
MRTQMDMKSPKNTLAVIIATVTLLFSMALQAAPRYISDQLQTGMRSGPGVQYRIVRMLESGTPIEALEDSEEWTRVRTNNDQEGWVLTRELMGEPPARNLLQRVSNDSDKNKTTLIELQKQQEQTQSSLNSSQSNIRQLRQEKEALEEQLRRAGEGLQLANTNQSLREESAKQKHEIQVLKEENEQLINRSRQDWFLKGAGVTVLGIILGLILPRLRLRPKTSYDRW